MSRAPRPCRSAPFARRPARCPAATVSSNWTRARAPAILADISFMTRKLGSPLRPLPRFCVTSREAERLLVALVGVDAGHQFTRQLLAHGLEVAPSPTAENRVSPNQEYRAGPPSSRAPSSGLAPPGNENRSGDHGRLCQYWTPTTPHPLRPCAAGSLNPKPHSPPGRKPF